MLETMIKRSSVNTTWLPQSQDGKRVSEADYWAYYYNDPDFCYEWNNGILEEKPMADYVKYVMYKWFVSLLDEFLKAHPIAKTTGLNIGFKLNLPYKNTGRRPDMGIIRNDNPVPIDGSDNTYKGIFDMCIESLSDSRRSEIERDTKDKKDEYARAGVPEYYILDDLDRYTAFYQLSLLGLYIPMPAPDGVIRSNVLPGFQFRIADLYSRPELKDLTEDHIYKNFVMLDYQQERERAEIAEIQTEQERERAEIAEIQTEQERERAEIAEIQTEQERERAEIAEIQTEQERAEKEQQRERAEIAEKQAKQYAAMLREAGILPSKDESHD
ncbi:Uma2 family endonuclease [Anaerolineales bacterium HSG24]|nr:Uma2 family endonuclease [Anaerolineales bacterium HSG24]